MSLEMDEKNNMIENEDVWRKVQLLKCEGYDEG